MSLPGSNKRTLRVQSLMSPNVIYQVPNLQCQLGLLQSNRLSNAPPTTGRGSAYTAPTYHPPLTCTYEFTGVTVGETSKHAHAFMCSCGCVRQPQVSFTLRRISTDLNYTTSHHPTLR